MPAPAPLPAVWPLIGRETELRLIQQTLDAAGAGRCSALIMSGESGVPYAIFADALAPAFRQLGDPAITLLSRGARSQLAYIFPALALDALAIRIASLGATTRTVADFAAVIGTRLAVDVLRAAACLEMPVLIGALEELCRRNVLVGQSAGEHVTYDFTHPTQLSQIYQTLGIRSQSELAEWVRAGGLLENGGQAATTGKRRAPRGRSAASTTSRPEPSR